MIYERIRVTLSLLITLLALIILVLPTAVPVRASPNNHNVEPMTIYSCFTDHRLLPPAPNGGDVVVYRIEYPYSELVSVRVISSSLSDYYWNWYWDLHYLRITIINYNEAHPLYIKWQVCVIYH